jgi:hypothetical protein
MRRLGWAALCAAGALTALAGEANATIMTAVFSGDFNDEAPHGHWGVNLTYDTSLAQITSFPTRGNFFSWSAASGTPSPILAGSAYFSKPPGISLLTWDLSDATAFSIEIHHYDYLFSLTGPTWQVNIGEATDFLPVHDIFPATGPLPSFDDAFSSGFTGYYYGVLQNGAFRLSPATLSMRITAPEPATWALMIGGFFGLGAALRLRRPVGATA